MFSISVKKIPLVGLLSFFIILNSLSINSQILNNQDLIISDNIIDKVNIMHNDNFIILNQKIRNKVKENLNLDGDKKLSQKFFLDESEEFIEIVSGLMLDNEQYEIKALNLLNSTKNKILFNKILFYLGVYYFNQGKYLECIKFTEKMEFEDFSNEQVLIIKFFQAYSNYELKNFKSAFILFDAVRQVKVENIYYYDANYYFAFLNILIGNNLKSALDIFRVIENDIYYKKVCPYYIASLLYALNRKEQVLEYLEEKLNAKSNLVFYDEINRLLCITLFEFKKYTRCIDMILRFNVKSSIDEFYLGVSYFKIDSLEKSLEVLSTINSQNEKLNFYRNLIMGQINLIKGNKEAARNYFFYCKNNIIDSSIQDFIIFINAKIYLDMGYNNIAFKDLKYFIDTFKESIYFEEARLLLLSTYAKTNNFKEAINLINSLGNFSNSSLLSQVYYGLAIDFYNERMLDSVNYFIDKAIKLNSNNVYYFYACLLKSELEYNVENYTSALLYLDRALAFYNVNFQLAQDHIWKIHYNMAYCYLKKDKYKQALILFSKIYSENYKLDSSGIVVKDVYLRMADCNYMLKNYKTAAEYYYNYLKMFSTNEDYVYYQLAMIDGINSPVNKVNLLKSIISKYPQTKLYKKIYFDIGLTQMSLNLFEESIKTFNYILSKNMQPSEESLALLNLGLSYYNLNRNKESLSVFKKLVEQFPNATEAEQAMGIMKEIYVSDEKMDNYLTLLKSIGKNYDYEKGDSLLFEIAEIKYREKKYEKSQMLFKNYLDSFPNGKKRIDAHYYCLNICFLQKKYGDMYSICDSIIAKGPSKFLEKSVLLSTQIPPITNSDSLKYLTNNELLYKIGSKLDNKITALKNIITYYYKRKDWINGYPYSLIILDIPKMANFYKSLALIFVSKKYYKEGLFDKAYETNNNIISLNSGALVAEAMYSNSEILIQKKDYTLAESNTFKIINQFYGHEKWVLNSYLLLSDIYLMQEDYFNSISTLKSLLKNSKDDEIVSAAKSKLLKIQELQNFKNSIKADSMKVVKDSLIILDSIKTN